MCIPGARKPTPGTRRTARFAGTTRLAATIGLPRPLGPRTSASAPSLKF